MTISENVFSVESFVEDNFLLLSYLSWQGAISGASGDLRRGIVFCDVSHAGQRNEAGTLSPGKAVFVDACQAVESLAEYGFGEKLVNTVAANLNDYDPSQEVIVLIYTGSRMHPLRVSEIDGMSPEECFNLVSPRAEKFMAQADA